MIDKYLLAAGEWGNVEVFDVSTPAAPVSVGNVRTRGEVNRIEVLGEYVYVLEHPGGLGILRLAPPSLTISKHPENLSVAAGNPAKLSVGAYGEGLTIETRRIVDCTAAGS